MSLELQERSVWDSELGVYSRIQGRRVHLKTTRMHLVMSIAIREHVKLWVLVILSSGLSPAKTRGQWTELNPNTQADLWSVHYRPDGVVWIGGFDTIYYGINAGNTLYKAPTYFGIGSFAPIFGLPLAVHALGPTNGLFTGIIELGESESIFKTPSLTNGYEWVHNANVGQSDFLNDIYLDDSGVGFAVGTNGRILRTSDDGTTWTPRPSGSTFELRSVTRVTDGIYLVASEDGLFRTGDEGLTWEIQPDRSGEWVTCVDGSCYLASSSGVVRSMDGGVTWSNAFDLPFQATAFEQLGAATIVFASNEGLFLSTTAGQYWERFPLQDYRTLKQIDFHNYGFGIGVGQGGYVIRTANAGGPTIPLARIGGFPATVCTSTILELTSLGDPSWDHQWLLNGELVGLDQVLVFPTTSAGPTVLQLVTSNGNGSDTATVEFNVNSVATVPDFEVNGPDGLVCPSHDITLNLTGLSAGVYYTAYVNGIAVDAVSGALPANTLSLGTIPVDSEVRVVGRRSNVCGPDTLERFLSIEVASVQQVTYTVESDTLCYPEALVIHLENIPEGFGFRANGLGSSTNWVVAQADTLTLTYPAVSEGSHQMLIYGSFLEQQWCTMPVQGSMPIWSFDPSSSISMDRVLLIPGEPLQFTAAFSDYTDVVWDFDEGAVPADHVGEFPPVVSYTSVGHKVITVSKWIGQGTCLEVDSMWVDVYDPAVAEEMPSCSFGQVEHGTMTIMDMELDGENAQIIIGDANYPYPNRRNFFVSKVDSAGNEVWRFRVEAPPNITTSSKAYACTVDPVGNVYVSFEIEANAQFDLQGVHLALRYGILKLDVTGVPQWVIGSSIVPFMGLSSSPNGLIYASGWSAPSPSGNSGSSAYLNQSNNTSYNIGSGGSNGGKIWVVAVNDAGMVVHANRFGRRHSYMDPELEDDLFPAYSDPLEPNNGFWNNPLIEISSSGDVLVTGCIGLTDTADYVKFDDLVVPDNSICVSNDDIGNAVFLARLSPELQVMDGALVLSSRPGLRVRGAGVNDEGAVVLSGRFSTSMCTGEELLDYPIPGQNINRAHGFVATFDSAFSVQWCSSSRYTDILDAEINDDGSVLALAGVPGIGVVVDANGLGHGLVVGGTYDSALLHFDPEGNLVGTERSLDPVNDISCWIQKDDCEAHHIVGVGTGFSNPRPYSKSFWGTGDIFTRTIGEVACLPECAGGNIPLELVPVPSVDDQLRLYPSINDGAFTVEWSHDWSGRVSLSLYDATGRFVLQRAAYAASGRADVSVDVGAGTYMVVLSGEDGRSATRRMVVVHH